MGINKRFKLYFFAIIWLTFFVSSINVLGDHEILTFKNGTKLLLYQSLPLHIILAFFFINRSKILNIIIGFIIWIISSLIIRQIKTETLTSTGDIVEGVVFMTIVYWILIGMIWELFFLVSTKFQRVIKS